MSNNVLGAYISSGSESHMISLLMQDDAGSAPVQEVIQRNHRMQTQLLTRNV
jgi:hypothetical protein